MMSSRFDNLDDNDAITDNHTTTPTLSYYDLLDPSYETLRIPVDELKKGESTKILCHPHDVLSGRGGAIHQHPGNKYFRELVKGRRAYYQSCGSRIDKSRLSREVINTIQSRVPPGRFLKRNPHGNGWVELSDDDILKKTSQALREGQAASRKRRAWAVKNSKLSSSPMKPLAKRPNCRDTSVTTRDDTSLSQASGARPSKTSESDTSLPKDHLQLPVVEARGTTEDLRSTKSSNREGLETLDGPSSNQFLENPPRVSDVATSIVQECGTPRNLSNSSQEKIMVGLSPAARDVSSTTRPPVHRSVESPSTPTSLATVSPPRRNGGATTEGDLECTERIPPLPLINDGDPEGKDSDIFADAEETELIPMKGLPRNEAPLRLSSVSCNQAAIGERSSLISFNNMGVTTSPVTRTRKPINFKLWGPRNYEEA